MAFFTLTYYNKYITFKEHPKMTYTGNGIRPRIGVYSTGLKTYWSQFEGLKERLTAYGEFIGEKISDKAEVFNYGLVDTQEAARDCGEWMNSHNVDLIFCHVATYATSDSMLPIHQICKAPVVILNLQPTARIAYDKADTGEWLAHCSACAAPEFTNALNRAGIPYRLISGLLGLDHTPAGSLADEDTHDRPEAKRAWKEIFEWVQAAGAVRTLRSSRFGFLGNTYSGMLDMYSDFTMIQAQAGVHIDVLEMCDLNQALNLVTKEEESNKLREIEDLFLILDDSPTDPRVKKPTPEQLAWAARVAAALDKMAAGKNLNALTYYYHSQDGNAYEDLQGGMIAGLSLLTAKNIPCAGEGDLKTCLAMKICDILGLGGSFSEIVITDYEDGTILIGHDGPFHIKIADSKPVLRGMGIYHGKKGSGISVEAKVKTGCVTTLNVTQTVNGKLKLIVSEAEATGGTIMTIGNTQTPVKFKYDPDTYMEKWFAEAPTHHCALSMGHNASLFKKVGELLGIETVIL